MRTVAALVARAAHAGVEKSRIASNSSRPSSVISAVELAARGLDLDPREAEPALDDVADEVDVLDARVGEVDLAPEEDAPAHRDALGVEAVAQRVVAEVERRERDEEERAEDERRKEVVGQELRARPFDGEDRAFVEWASSVMARVYPGRSALAPIPRAKEMVGQELANAVRAASTATPS